MPRSCKLSRHTQSFILQSKGMWACQPRIPSSDQKDKSQEIKTNGQKIPSLLSQGKWNKAFQGCACKLKMLTHGQGDMFRGGELSGVCNHTASWYPNSWTVKMLTLGIISNLDLSKSCKH